MFYRAIKVWNDGESYGVGLSIADSIVQEHRGTIRAEGWEHINTLYVSIPSKR